MTLELLLCGALAGASPQAAESPAPPPLTTGDRVVVTTDDRQSIRGRIAEITADSLVLDGARRVRVPLASLRQIDRVGDSPANGAAIGAGIGGGATLALIAKICSNSNCTDTSASQDPRLVLAGSLIGAGVGAIIDAAIARRRTVFRAGQSYPAPTTRRDPVTTPVAGRVMIFGRVGWARLTDDEGTLGDGGSMGVGTIVALTPRIGVQVAYDRHDHRRDFEPAGPPGSTASGGFTGTEQLVTAKVLFFFRTDRRVRPYVGIGGGFLDSDRVSEFPTFVPGSRGFPEPGPPEVFRYHTTGRGFGFATGMDVRVTTRFSTLGDLTLDLNDPDALGSTRLTIGAGWRF